jgi:hypothetical protein
MKVSNKHRGNGHWILAYMPLQDNLGGEARKGVLTRGGDSVVARGATGRRRRRGAEGVVEVSEEEVGEELPCGVKLAAGSTGWGNKQRRLPLVRCSRRKTSGRKSHGPTS